MERIRITDLDCVLLDAVLLLSFDARELANLAMSTGGADAACTCGRRALDVVHRACHAGDALARRVERTLDLIHRQQVERLAVEGLPAFAGALLGGDLPAVTDLAGSLWAVLGCDEPEAEGMRAHLRRALLIDGLRLVAREQTAS